MAEISDTGSLCILSWLSNLENRYGDSIALISEDENASLSYAEVSRLSVQLAVGLKQFGFRRGDSIAIWLPNSPIWLIVHFAAAMAGLLTIPINTWCRDSEVSHLLRLGKCKAIFLDRTFRNIDFDEILNSALREMDELGENPLNHVVLTKSSRIPLIDIPQLDLTELVSIGEDSVCKLTPEFADTIAFSTSGTTSQPKLALYDATRLVLHAQAVARKAHFTSRDVTLAALPLCGAYGYGLVLASLAAGCRVIHCKEFNVDCAIELISSAGVSILALTEPILRQLMEHPKSNCETFSTVRIMFSAGATLFDVVDHAESELGVRVSNVYGSSEVLALAAFWDESVDVRERCLAGGELVSDAMYVRAVDADGCPVAQNTPGALEFQGPIVTKGYLDNPTATASAFTPDGWYRSQDLGLVLDAKGRSFHYISRMNDAIRLKGFLVNPGEIEEMLQKNDDVTAAQVVGIPNDKGEDSAVAFVIMRGSSKTSPDELKMFCREHMASYKVPSSIVIVDSFPMTKSANGDKVVKKQLQAIAKDLIKNER